MFVSKYEETYTTQEMVSTFGGYCHKDVIQDGQWYDMKNMYAGAYPAIRTRPQRQGINHLAGEKVSQIAAICDKDGPVWLGKDGSLHAGGNKLEGFYTWTEADRQLVSMGAYLIVWPDKVWANAAKLALGQELRQGEDYGSLEVHWSQGNDTPGDVVLEQYSIQLVPCQRDGSNFKYIPEGYIEASALPEISYDALLENNLPAGVVLTNTYPYQLYRRQAADKWYPEGDYYGYYVSNDKPEDPDDGYLWMDTSGDAPVLRQWYSATSMWMEKTVYLRLEYAGGFAGIDVGDAVDIQLPTKIYSDKTVDAWGLEQGYYSFETNPLGTSGLLENAVILDKGPDYLIIEGTLAAPATIGSYHRQLVNCALAARYWSGDMPLAGESYVPPEMPTVESLWAMSDTDLVEYIWLQQGPTNAKLIDSDGHCVVTISRTVPDMDFVIESGNRLWGCFYGVAADGQILNEIYASKLGDFKNWHCYAGLSTDSYTASRGVDGPWTGAVTLNNYPLFFKRNCVEKVYVSASGAHQIATTKMPGVAPGSWRSLQIIDGILFYHSDSGVMCYDGSLPDHVSADLGGVKYKNAVAGRMGYSYYLSLENPEGGHDLFVLDTSRGIWHREDDLAVAQTASRGDVLYLLTADGRLLTPGTLAEGDQGSVEEDFTWELVGGVIGYSRAQQEYLKRITVRLKLELGASARLYVRYDDEDRWIRAACLEGNGLKSSSVPVRPRRCDHFRIKLEGIGQATIYSMCREIEKGSEET